MSEEYRFENGEKPKNDELTQLRERVQLLENQLHLAKRNERRQFAAMMAQGLLSGVGAELNQLEKESDWDFGALAKTSVICAEALIKELDREK